MRRSIAFAGLVLASACFDHVLVEPEPNVPTLFGVSVRVAQDTNLSYMVEGYLQVGTDQIGNPRSLEDSVMQVASGAVTGVRSADLELVKYAWSGTARRDTLAVKGPTFAGQSTATTTLLIPMPSRIGPAFLQQMAGGDVQFNVETFGTNVYGFGIGGAAWSLEVENQKQGNRLRLQGQGRPTFPIVIPWSVLQATSGDSLVATLYMISTQTSVLTAYPTALSISAELRWHVRIMSAPTP